MRRLKYTAIAALLISTLTACGSSLETAADYVESGKELVKEGKLQKARLEFKNAIQIDPRTADAFYQLALLDEKAQDWKSMYANLSTTEQLAPNHHDASVKLGQLYLLSGNYDEARARVKKVVDVTPGHLGATVLKASIELKQQNFGLAIADADSVLAQEPENIEAISVKVMAYNSKSEHSKALELLEQALAIKPDNLSLIMIKLSILESQKNYSEVEKVYRQLRQDKPSERWVVASLAKLLNMQDRYDEAKTVLEQFIAEQPDDRDAKLMLVSLVQTREPEQAIVLLDRYAAADETDFELLFAKIKLQLDSGQTEQALAGLAAVVEKDPEGNNGRKAEMVLANYEFQQGNLAAVEEKLDRVLTVAPEDEAALILKSKINIMNDNIDTAITDLRVILRNNLESDEAMVLLGQAYLKSGSQELAEDHFRQALSVNPGNRGAAIFVADSLVRADNAERAESVIMTALQENPNDVGLLQALANIKLHRGDWSGAEQIAKALSDKGVSSAVTLFMEGRALQGKKEHVLAIEKLKAALSAEPKLIDALRGIAYSYVELDDKASLKAFLEEQIEFNPKSMTAYSLLSEVLVSEKDWSAVVETSQSGLSNDKQWLAGYFILSSAQQQLNDNLASLATMERAALAFPDDNAVAIRLASAYESEKQFDKAKMAYENILARSPEMPVAINNLASLLTDHFKSDENLQKALKISGPFANSTEPYFMDTYAWIHVQLGQLDKAQSILERVVEKAPNVAVFNYHLGVLYHKQAKLEQAEQYLKQAQTLAQQQDDQDLIKRVDEVLSAL